MELAKIKKKIWEIVGREGLLITNQNIDWLLERAFNEMQASLGEEQR